MADDPGFTINWFWMLAQAVILVLFIVVIIAIGLLLRSFAERGRKLSEMDARLARIEKSLDDREAPTRPQS